jgi:CHAD domain-containing protein
MARAASIPGLNPGTRFADAAAAAIEVRAREVFAHADGVLDTSDIERVHDMRVATRRLRAAMEVFAACFDKREHKRLLREVKALADVLGDRRDPDVAIHALNGIAAQLTATDRPGVESLVHELRQGQDQGNDRLAAALEQLTEARLEERLLALARAARRPEPAPPALSGTVPG